MEIIQGANIELENDIVGLSYLLSVHYFPYGDAGVMKDISEFVKQYKVYETVKLSVDLNKVISLIKTVIKNGLSHWSILRCEIPSTKMNIMRLPLARWLNCRSGRC